MLSEHEQEFRPEDMTGAGTMNPEVKEAWVKELRSGNYRQGKGVLRARALIQKDSFCCLGVLCEVAYREGIVDQEDSDGYVLYDSAMAFLPESVQEWAHVDRDGRFGIGPMHTLVSQNDEGGKDFDGIADLIEKYL